MSKTELSKCDLVELVENMYFMRIDEEISHTISVTLYEIVAWETDNTPAEVEKIGSAYVKFDGDIHMWLGDEDKYSYISDADSYCKMIKTFSQICLNLVCSDKIYIDHGFEIKKQKLSDELKKYIYYLYEEN